MRKNRILFVLTYYRPHWTGLTRYAARLAEGLAKRNWRVRVICAQHDKELKKKEIINNVSVKRIPFLCRLSRTFLMPFFLVELWGEIKRSDTIVAYLPLQQVLATAMMVKILGKKLFLVHNGDLVLPEEAGALSRVMEKIYFGTTLLAGKLSQVVIIQTKDYAEHSKLLKGLKNKWRVVMPLFNTPKIKKTEVKIFLQKYDLQGKKLIGFSGRFVEEKGVDCLLRAIPLVIKVEPKAHFLFAGDYKIKYENFWEKIQPLAEKYKNHIRLLSLLDKRQVYIFYKSLRVLVQPSRTDCFPSSQIEALLSGIPCICTNIPGARWPIKETKMGLVVKAESSKDLAKGIINLLKSKKDYKKEFGKVKEIFNYQSTLDKYEEIFWQD